MAGGPGKKTVGSEGPCGPLVKKGTGPRKNGVDFEWTSKPGPFSQGHRGTAAIVFKGNFFKVLRVAETKPPRAREARKIEKAPQKRLHFSFPMLETRGGLAEAFSFLL